MNIIFDKAVEHINKHIAQECWVFTSEELKAFAEDIVKECFDVVIRDNRFNDCKGIIRSAALVAKEHFGVK